MLQLSPFADHGTSNNNTCALYSIGDLFNSQLGHQPVGLSFSVPIDALLHDHFHTKYTSHHSSFQWRPVRLQELMFLDPIDMVCYANARISIAHPTSQVICQVSSGEVRCSSGRQFIPIPHFVQLDVLCNVFCKLSCVPRLTTYCHYQLI